MKVGTPQKRGVERESVGNTLMSCSEGSAIREGRW
jgi:hypothetical protein